MIKNELPQTNLKTSDFFYELPEERIAQTVNLCRQAGVSIPIQVDGGVKESTVERIAAAGADVFVMGSACFTAADPKAAMQAVRELGTKAAAAALSGR
jgi:ribulose-phosphate 3-epimerase